MSSSVSSLKSLIAREIPARPHSIHSRSPARPASSLSSQPHHSTSPSHIFLPVTPPFTRNTHPNSHTPSAISTPQGTRSKRTSYLMADCTEGQGPRSRVLARRKYQSGGGSIGERSGGMGSTGTRLVEYERCRRPSEALTIRLLFERAKVSIAQSLYLLCARLEVFVVFTLVHHFTEVRGN